VDADGERIADGATEAARFAVQSGGSSFAAPPPVAAAVVGTRAPMPRLVLVLVVIQGLLSLGVALMQGVNGMLPLAIRLAILGGLITGDRTAYRVALFSWLVVVFADLYFVSSLWHAIVWLGRAVGIVITVWDGAFLSILLSPEVRRHYEKSTVA
jgi:hypothetical protein